MSASENISHALMTFPLFKSLPPELRHDIYWLATPPRVVVISLEMEDWDEFWARWATDPMTGLYVHPDISYYTARWVRDDRPGTSNRRRQMALTAYGFPARRPRQGHWVHEDHFPFESVLGDREAIFNMFQRCRLYSSTPIPPLLHTCSESRAALMGRGYELAFGSRTFNPQTWFNFQTDILQVSEGADLVCLIHPGGDAHTNRPVGQFRPQDLRRVRQIVCSRAYGPRYLILCQLMPNLRHVYIPAYEDFWTQAKSFWVTKSQLAARVPRLPPTRPAYFRYILPFEEIDLIWSTTPYYQSQFRHETDMMLDGMLMLWKQAHGFDGSFFDSLEHRIRNSLQQCLIDQRLQESSRQTSDGECGLLTMLEAPQFHLVHLLTIGEAELIGYYRQAFWSTFSSRREQWLKSQSDQSTPHGHTALQNHHQSELNMTWADVFSGERLPLDRRDHETKLDWWVKNGAPHTRSPGFAAVFP